MLLFQDEVATDHRRGFIRAWEALRRLSLLWLWPGISRQATDIQRSPGGQQPRVPGGSWLQRLAGDLYATPRTHHGVLNEPPGLSSSLTRPSVQTWETLFQQPRRLEPPALPAVFKLTLLG